MRRVTKAGDLPAALASGSHEAASAFGDGAVYLEREIAPARHIEVQLLGDATGRVIALGERDCSLQRRHQKLVEEAPAPGLSTDERRHLHALAVRVATAAGLRNAATAEFLRAPDGAFYFLEVNTRLQVEHGVTELVSGLDIVREQLWLAAGRPLSDEALAAAARAAEPTSHAIEVRMSAEDPGRDFAPTPGRVGRWVMPAGPGVRVDTALEPGDRVPPEYDNLIAKVMVHAGDRDAAIDRLRRALDETEISGIQTTLPFHRFVAIDPTFRAGTLSTGWVGEHWDGPGQREAAARIAQLAAGLQAMRDRPRGADGCPPRGAPVAVAGCIPGRSVAPLRARDRRRPVATMTDRPAPTAPVEAAGRQLDPRGVRVSVVGADLDTLPPVVLEPAPVDLVPTGPRTGVGLLGGLTEGPATPVRADRDGRPRVDGAPLDADLEVIGPERAILRADGRAHRLLLLTPDATGLGGRAGVDRREVIVGGWRVEVDVESATRAALQDRARRGREEAGHSGPTQVHAIIPGVVVSVSIAQGDAVTAGQQLLVVEAMKMQNELRSPRDGTIERGRRRPGLHDRRR